jgi:hypothetical protein
MMAGTCIYAGVAAGYVTTSIPEKELRCVLGSITVLSEVDMVRRSFAIAKKLPK